jgi:hypothetical protein
MRLAGRLWLCVLVGTTIVHWMSAPVAFAEPPAAPPPPKANVATADAAAPPAAAPMVAAPAAAAPAPAPPPPEAAPAATPPPSEGEKAAHMNAPPPPAPTIALNVGVRSGLKLQDPMQPKKMSEVHTDSLYAEVRLHGDLNDMFGWVANFNAGIDKGVLGPVAPMDLIAKFHAHDAFNIWLGRLLVPCDRSNFTGPFFMIPWNYPGVYPAGFVGPMEGPNGRNEGVTAWGMAADDKFKYYVGAYGIDKNAQPFYSARVSYNIQGSEPGYFGSSTYFGEKSVAAVGVAAQYQKAELNATPPVTKDFTSIMADVLAEEVVSGVGTFTFEGQFYAFGINDLQPAPKEAFYLLGAYLTPNDVGIGKIQPMVRVQQTIDPSWTVVDAQLGYIMKAYFLKLIANYQYGVANGATTNMLQFGAQMQM